MGLDWMDTRTGFPSEVSAVPLPYGFLLLKSTQ